LKEEMLTDQEAQEYAEKREQEESEMFENKKCIPYCLNGNYR